MSAVASSSPTVLEPRMVTLPDGAVWGASVVGGFDGEQPARIPIRIQPVCFKRFVFIFRFLELTCVNVYALWLGRQAKNHFNRTRAHACAWRGVVNSYASCFSRISFSNAPSAGPGFMPSLIKSFPVNNGGRIVGFFFNSSA